MTEWAAQDYHARSALQAWLAETSLAGLDLDGAESVLDLGCGDGRITAEIAGRLPAGRALGVDPSHRMVEYARGAYAAPNLRFEIADARTLPFEADFDLVVSFNALHWVRQPDQPRAMAALARSLRPGGRTFLQFVGAGPRTSLEDVIEEVATSPAWGSWFPDFVAPYFHPTPEEYRALAQAAGLAVEAMDLAAREWDFGSDEAFTKWCEATFVEWTNRLPAERHPDFIAEVLARYRDLAGPHVFRFYQFCTRLRKPAP